MISWMPHRSMGNRMQRDPDPKSAELTRRSVLGTAAAVTMAAHANATETASAGCRIGPPPHPKGPLVFMNYDQIELDAAYDQSSYAPLAAQIALPGAFTAEFTVVRALLRHGRVYEKAVEAFAPYKQIQDPNPEAREAMKTLIARAESGRQGAYIFVNNRFEGNAPSTIEAIID